MSHYSQELINSQKEVLENQKVEVEQELEKVARFDEESGSYIALQPEYDAGSAEDSGEASFESETLQTNAAVVSELQANLDDINAALSKIDMGEYGVCEASGDMISEERLRAYPAARTCEEESV